ncbi:putative nucleocapsid [Emaravirus verbanni]|uniref:Putative nucleocapsid n=1 Tax=Emaravirus verbanni TaxID=2843908 RepID=A0A6B9EXK1_9VIRU|nr:putative nucleocapsid [Emaravirus verbanni]QGX73509.1 putative nucleocapsid [Emaravirus verbanni]
MSTSSQKIIQLKGFANSKVPVKHSPNSNVFTKAKEFSEFFHAESYQRNQFDLNDEYYKNTPMEQITKIFESIKEIKDELNEQVKINKYLKLKLTCFGSSKEVIDKEMVYIIKNPVVTTSRFLTINQLSSLTAFKIAKFKLGTVYSWESRKYIPVEVQNSSNIDIVNRLALKIGLNQDNPDSKRLYYIYTTGFENLFESFPEEVVAICLYKAKMDNISLNKEDSKYDSLKNLISKIIRVGFKHSILNDNMKNPMIVLSSLNINKIRELYNVLENCRQSGLSSEYKTAIDDLLKLFNFNFN